MSMSMLTYKPSTITDKPPGLIIMLINSDQDTLGHLSHKLSHNNKHNVSSTTRASSALRMISNGHTYDCLFIDDDKCDMDLMDFLHQILKRQPRLPVIVMGSKETRQRIAKEADQEYKTISFILKPCDIYSQICRGLEYVLSQRMGCEEGTSNGKLHQRKLAHNIFHRADTLIKSSAVMSKPMINHNVLSSNGTHGGLNLNSQNCGVMCKPQTYVNISSDDDGESSMTNNCTDLANNKGKQPIFDLKRKSYQLVEDSYRKKRTDCFRPRTAWTRELASDFKTLSAVFNREKAYRSTIPITLVNVPGLEHNHIASHQQMYHERNKYMKIPTAVGPSQIRYNNSQVESYGIRSYARSTPFGNDASSIIQSRNFQKLPMKLNSVGISLMSFENLQTHLEDFPQLTWPQQTTTTTINTTGGDLFPPTIGETSISNALGLFENPENGGSDLFQPPIGETSISNALGLSENPENGASDQGIHQVQNTVVGYGIGKEPLVTTENFSQNIFANIEVAPPSGATEESEFNFLKGFDELSQVIIGSRPISNDLGLVENLENTGDQGIHEGQSAVSPASVGATVEPQFRFSNGFDELSQVLYGLVENPGSGNGQGSEVQTEAVGYGIGTTPLGTIGETFPEQTLGEEMAPLSVGATVELEFNFLNDFGTANYADTDGNGVSEILAPVDCYGIPIEDLWENHGDSAATTPNDFNLEDLDCPIVENLYDPENPLELNFSNLDANSFGDASASATVSVALNGSADSVSENNWFVRMINHDREISMEGLGENCGHLINGTFGSEDSPWSI